MENRIILILGMFIVLLAAFVFEDNQTIQYTLLGVGVAACLFSMYRNYKSKKK
jgi:hypothetical protein